MAFILSFEHLSKLLPKKDYLKFDISQILSLVDNDFLIEQTEKLISQSLYFNLFPPKYNNNRILDSFFYTEDVEGDISINNLLNSIVRSSDFNGNPISIINTRTSLDFYRLIYSSTNNESSLTTTEKRWCILIAYLKLNQDDRRTKTQLNDSEESLINGLIDNELRTNVNTSYLSLIETQLSHLIRACEFFLFFEANHPNHLLKFYKKYGIEYWTKYTISVYEIFKLSLKLLEDSNGESAIFRIVSDDKNYHTKKLFLSNISEMNYQFQKDFDYTNLKVFPVREIDANTFTIPYLPFLSAKMFDSLYFDFKMINFELKGTVDYIKDLKSYIGKCFSEEVLFTKLIESTFSSAFTHLNYTKLLQASDPDYIIRDNKRTLIFECKDNLLTKEELEECSIAALYPKLEEVFLQDRKGNKKGASQLANNIKRFYDYELLEDVISPEKQHIYPVLVVHNPIFSSNGINHIVNGWFIDELKKYNIDNTNIKRIVIIDIDTLIANHHIFAQNKFNLYRMIDKYQLYLNELNYKIALEKTKWKSSDEKLHSYNDSLDSFADFVAKQKNKIKTQHNNRFTEQYVKYFSSTSRKKK